MRYSLTTLAKAIMVLTQPSIDRAVCYTRQPGLAEAWHERSYEQAQAMLVGTEPYAEQAAQTVVAFAFGPTGPDADFWESPLGRFLFKKGGFPPRNPTKKEVAYILGVTHQAVSDLIKRGRLMECGTNVDKAGVVARLRLQMEEEWA